MFRLENTFYTLHILMLPHLREKTTTANNVNGKYVMA